MDLINLQRLSSICIASIIWDKPEIKRQIKELFLSKPSKLFQDSNIRQITFTNPPSFIQDTERYQNYQLIIQSALLSFHEIELHAPIKKSCQDVVTELGEKIYDWTEQVTDVLQLDLKFAEKVFWSPFGTVDENKIFELWEKDKNFLSKKSAFSSAPVSFIIACINAKEDFIEKNQNEMEKILQIRMPGFNLNNYNHKVYTLTALFLNCFVHQYTSNISNSDLVIPPEIMFQLSSTACLPKAAYYFWNFLSKYEQRHCLREACQSCLRESNYYFSRTSYQRDKLAEFLIFLIRQMTVDQRNDFIQENIVPIFYRVLPVWPYNEMILPLINNHFSGLTAADYQKILIFTQILIKENKLEYKINYFRSVLKKILTDLPETLKREIINSEFLDESFGMFDVKNLILLFTNMDRESRSMAIQRIRPHILLLAKEGKIRLIDEFMEKILENDNERNEYRNHILSFINELLEDMKLETADHLLDYLSSSTEERIILKNKINCLPACEKFMIRECRYDKAEKILEWMFKDEEEKERFRNSLDANWFMSVLLRFSNCSS